MKQLICYLIGRYYWLDSYVIKPQTTTSLAYGLRRVYPNGIDYDYIYYSNLDYWARQDNVRCVVELSPNIQIGEKDPTLGWSYTI